MSNFALSTVWNAKKNKDALTIIDEIRRAGFKAVELYFTLTKKIVDEIFEIVKRGGIKVSSLHNYCPVPEGVKEKNSSPDYYSLASLDENERKRAVYFTNKTIDEAQRLGAEAVVLHCGKVKANDNTKKLIELYESGGKDSCEFIKMSKEMSGIRDSKSGLHIDRVLKSLDEIADFTKEKNIVVGIENRFYFMEIPSLEEVGIILDRFKGSRISYWHDTGHAQVCENLGFLRHKDFLMRFGPQISGIHLHDVIGCIDHLAPGCGNFDFSILKPYIGSSIIKVIEAHSQATDDELRHAVTYLDKALGGIGTK